MQELGFPWIFYRDELDLFEDEIEDLLHRHEVKEGDSATVESLILDEHIQSEETSDAATAQRLGIDFSDQDLFAQIVHRELDNDNDRVSQIVAGQNFRHHPMYQLSRKWAHQLLAHSKKEYQSGGAYSGAFFRVHVCANLVPVKVFTGLSEESYDDVVGMEVAQELFILALVYVMRILESLNVNVLDVRSYEKIRSMQKQGEELRALIIGHLAELKRRTA
jgi:hypothetical protein